MTTLSRADGISDQTLIRMVKWGAAALAVLIGVFGVIYYRGQHVDTGPTLADRQVQSAVDAVKTAPQNVQLRLRLAATYQAVGRVDDALAQYDEVLKAVPSNRTALLGKSQLQMNAGDLDAAAAGFNKIIKDSAKAQFSNVDTQIASAHFYLASIAATRGNNPEAIKEYSAALDIDPTDADTLYALGAMQSKTGDDKSAVANYRRALMFVPTGWCEPYQGLASSYGKLGDKDGAEYAGAMGAFCTGDAQGATTRLQTLSSGPYALDALLGIGLIAETQSDRTAAEAAYKRALVVNPGNATALTALGRLGDGTVAAPGAATSTPQAKAK